LCEQQISDPPEQRFLVQHKVPRVIADLVKGQFHLMQEWMRPLLEESIDTGRDLEQLKQQLETVLQSYQEVEASFQSARVERDKPPS
jgi:hypothetical protein